MLQNESEYTFFFRNKLKHSYGNMSVVDNGNTFINVKRASHYVSHISQP